MQARNPDGFIVRPFKLDIDVPLFVNFRNSLVEANGGDVYVSEDEVRQELDQPNQKPEEDRWVAVANDAPEILLGFGQGYHTLPERYLVWIEVHPAWRRNGLGTALLRQVITRARQVNSEHITIYVSAGNEVAQKFLYQNYFEEKDHAWFMSASTGISLAEPVFPSGYTARCFAEVPDYRILKDAYYGSCRDMWGHGANSKKREQEIQPIAEDWHQWFTESDPDGQGIFFAFAPDGNVAGVCRGIDDTCRNKQDNGERELTGIVDALGTVPKYRSHNLQRSLALTAMRWLRQRGHSAFVLESYGANENTIDIYRELGFHLDEKTIAYHRQLER